MERLIKTSSMTTSMSSLKKLYGRYRDYIFNSMTSLSYDFNEIVEHNKKKDTIHRPGSRLTHDLGTYFDLKKFITEFREFPVKHLQRVLHADRGRLLHFTPGPVLLRTYICSSVETRLSKSCHVSGLRISNTYLFFNTGTGSFFFCGPSEREPTKYCKNIFEGSPKCQNRMNKNYNTRNVTENDFMHSNAKKQPK